MPTYHFHLRTKDGTVLDPDGTELPNQALALGHARMVAAELMQYREPRTRYWRLDVYDGDGRRCFDLVFATADPSISHLTPELRRLVETVCASAASLFDTVEALNLKLLQIKATEARSKRAPYLAAINGSQLRLLADGGHRRSPEHPQGKQDDFFYRHSDQRT